MNIIESTFLVLTGSCLAACSYYYDYYCKENEWLRKCRSTGRDEYPCPGARVEECHFYLHNDYGRRVCTCYPGSLRSKSGKCVDPSDCEPEYPLPPEQEGLMQRARENEEIKKGGEGTQRERKTMVRKAMWLVKLKWQTPAVSLEAYDGDTRDSSVSGVYVLFAANNDCLVVGTVRDERGVIYKKVEETAVKAPLHGSLCFYWMKEGSSKAKRNVCDEAFYKMCTSIKGDFYAGMSEKCYTTTA